MYRQSCIGMIPPSRMMNIFIFMKLQNLSVENLSKHVYSEFVSSDLLVSRLNTKCFLLSQSLMVFESSGWLHSFGPQFLLIIASKHQSYKMNENDKIEYLSIWLKSRPSYKAKYKQQSRATATATQLGVVEWHWWQDSCRFWPRLTSINVNTNIIHSRLQSPLQQREKQ